jgi:hypothetical protein
MKYFDYKIFHPNLNLIRIVILHPLSSLRMRGSMLIHLLYPPVGVEGRKAKSNPALSFRRRPESSLQNLDLDPRIREDDTKHSRFARCFVSILHFTFLILHLKHAHNFQRQRRGTGASKGSGSRSFFAR